MPVIKAARAVMRGDTGEMETIKRPSAARSRAQMCFRSGDLKKTERKCGVCCCEGGRGGSFTFRNTK